MTTTKQATCQHRHTRTETYQVKWGREWETRTETYCTSCNKTLKSEVK